MLQLVKGQQSYLQFICSKSLKLQKLNAKQTILLKKTKKKTFKISPEAKMKLVLYIFPNH